MNALAGIARLDGEALHDEKRSSHRDALYGLLRREQAISASTQSPSRSETARILDLAQAAYGDVVGVVVGRDDSLLDSARDGEWSLRDVLRHAMAVELRYAAQVLYSATRAESDPVEIPSSLLPCDRLSPPEPEFSASRRGEIGELLMLLAKARIDSDAVLVNVLDSALDRPSLWGKQLLNVRMRLHQIAVHLTETAVQIQKIVGGEGELRAIVHRCCITRGMHERWSPRSERQVLDDAYRALLLR